MGSSPLARGPLDGEYRCYISLGLIPARAGTTCVHRECRSPRRAHPRSRGDHSSLLPRGIGVVGNRAHPRSRGDHTAATAKIERPMGSSPLARGPHFRRDCRLLCLGLIPARAGTTFSIYATAASLEAHPRSRGDHMCVVPRGRIWWGSSPLARGPRQGYTPPPTEEGLIPARAGTTYGQRQPAEPSRAHPRSRGDHGTGQECCEGGAGSSPLARGPPREANFG